MFLSAARRRYNIILRSWSSTLSKDKKKLTITNVFQDNPAAKYWLLGGFVVASGVTYYLYNNQKKKKIVLNILPPYPSHYCSRRPEDVEQLKVLLRLTGSGKYPKEVKIFGPSGSGKTQLARLLAESLNQSRLESYEFKLWPKDEVTACLNACSKNSLLLDLKQLAVKLGCSKDEVKLDDLDLESQLDTVSQVVQDKLKKKSQWILLIDHHDTSRQLTKWLPNSDWGDGYVIHTSTSEGIGNLEKQTSIPNYHLNQMTAESAIQLFHGILSESNKRNDCGIFPENLLKLLQYNPLSLTYAAIFYKYQIGQNDKYTYQDLFCDLEKTVQQLNEMNPETSELLNIQTSCVTLAMKAVGESSPKLLHVFDLLGSCKPGHPIPFGVLLCHLKTPEYHVDVKPDIDVTTEGTQPNEETESNVKITADLEGEPSLWSFHGITSRVVSISERVKLEFDALKSLFGYGSEMSGSQVKPLPDGLEFVRSCPLLIRAYEPMADVEVLSSHPIVHNVFRQCFLNVTVALLERQHLLLAERKHQRKSFFGRLQRFDPQKVICEYRKSLGDQEQRSNLPTVQGSPAVAAILSASSGTGVEGENSVLVKYPNIIGHIQEHFNRVVSSFSNYYRMAGGDNNGMVARSLLLPHVEALLRESCSTAASKGQLYQTMGRIYSDVLGNLTTSKRLLDEAYVIYHERFGENSVEMAALLEQQAELLGISEELEQSKALLERALNIYQKDRKTTQTSKHPFEYGKTLVALGVTCGSLGETARSKDMLEKGLMELQNAAPENPQAKENKWFAAEISSAVTSLGHAYLSLGNINQGRKLLELALIGHQNALGDCHPEVIRALTTLSIAHAMQGNSQESKRLRNEAGKIKKKLEMKTPLIVR